MTANIQWATGTFDDPNRLGDLTAGGVAIPVKFPLFGPENAKVLFEYVVPAGKVATIKNLLITLVPSGNLYVISGTPTEAGLVYLVVDGSTKFEGRLQPTPLNSINNMQTVEWGYRSCMSLGEGVDFTSGQVVKVQALPMAPFGSGARLLSKWVARLHGKAVSGGAVDMQTGALRTPATGTALDILSYTVPANGLRLFYWDVNVFVSETIVASVQVLVNGACVGEYGYLCVNREQTVFRSSASCMGVIPISGFGDWGMKLNHGDRIQVLGHAYLDYGQAVGVQMACDETAEIGVEPA
jgi:hypothetical protein